MKDKLILTAAIGFGAYVVGQMIIFRQIEAISYWEVKGYINGLTRGAGSSEEAYRQLNAWYDYWEPKVWWKGLLDHFYSYGEKRINILY